jgi:hypothetical protein
MVYSRGARRHWQIVNWYISSCLGLPNACGVGIFSAGIGENDREELEIASQSNALVRSQSS